MKKSGSVTLGLGIVLIAATILWMTVGLGALLKIPTGQDATSYSAGTATFYVNPATQQPLPAGQEIKLPMEIERRVFTVDGETTGDKIVFQEVITSTLGVQKQQRVSQYVLDRKTSVNLTDDRAYDWVETNPVDRAGTYYPLLPMNTTRDEAYSVWKGEVGMGVIATFMEEQTVDGVKLLVFGGPVDRAPVVPAYVQLSGFPESISFSALAQQLKAAGFDAEAFLAMALPRMTPEDQQALAGITQQPIPLTYYWDVYQVVGIEPITGLPMDIIETKEAMSMSPDLKGLVPLFSVLMKYKDDPVLGPYLQQLAALQGTLASAGPSKIISLDYRQTDESVQEMADLSKTSINKVKLAKTYIPIVGFALGGLLLIAGIVMVLKKKKSPA
jgi:hypothetical protein